MSRQILYLKIEIKEFLDPRILEVESRITKLALRRILRIFPLPGSCQARQPGYSFDVEPENLPYLATGRAPSIGDDVRSHRRASAAILFINVLDYQLALIS